MRAVSRARCAEPVAHGRIVEQVDEFAHLRRRDGSASPAPARAGSRWEQAAGKGRAALPTSAIAGNADRWSPSATLAWCGPYQHRRAFASAAGAPDAGRDPASTAVALRQTVLERARAARLVGYGGLCYLPDAARATDNASCPRTEKRGRRTRSKSGKRTSACQHVGLRRGQPLRQRLVRSRQGARRASSRSAQIWPSLQQAIAESDDLRQAAAQPDRQPRAARARHRGDRRAHRRLGDRRATSWACWRSQRRLGALPAIIDRFASLLAAHRGEETAEVTSAVAARRGAARQRARGGRRAMPAGPFSSPPRSIRSLLGGLVVRIGSRMVDASLKTKLHNLELSMRGIR